MNLQQFAQGMEYFECPILMTLPIEPIRIFNHPHIPERSQIFDKNCYETAFRVDELCVKTRLRLTESSKIADCRAPLEYFLLTVWQTFHGQEEALNDAFKLLLEEVIKHLTAWGVQLGESSVKQHIDQYKLYYRSLREVSQIDLGLLKVLDSLGVYTNYTALRRLRFEAMDDRIEKPSNHLHVFDYVELEWLTSNFIIYTDHLARTGTVTMQKSFINIIDQLSQRLCWVLPAHAITRGQNKSVISVCIEAHLDSSRPARQYFYAEILLHFIKTKCVLDTESVRKLFTYYTRGDVRFQSKPRLDRHALTIMALNSKLEQWVRYTGPFSPRDVRMINSYLIEPQAPDLLLDRLNAYSSDTTRKIIEGSSELVMKFKRKISSPTFMSQHGELGQIYSNMSNEFTLISQVHSKWLMQQLDARIINNSGPRLCASFPKRLSWYLGDQELNSWSPLSGSSDKRQAFSIMRQEVENHHVKSLQRLGVALVKMVYEIDADPDWSKLSDKITQKISKTFFYRMERLYSQDEVARALAIPKFVEMLKSDYALHKQNGLSYMSIVKDFILTVIDFFLGTRYNCAARVHDNMHKQVNLMFGFPKLNTTSLGVRQEAEAASISVTEYSKRALP